MLHNIFDVAVNGFYLWVFWQIVKGFWGAFIDSITHR